MGNIRLGATRCEVPDSYTIRGWQAAERKMWEVTSLTYWEIKAAMPFSSFLPLKMWNTGTPLDFAFDVFSFGSPYEEHFILQKIKINQNAIQLYIYMYMHVEMHIDHICLVFPSYLKIIKIPRWWVFWCPPKVLPYEVVAMLSKGHRHCGCGVGQDWSHDRFWIFWILGHDIMISHGLQILGSTCDFPCLSLSRKWWKKRSVIASCVIRFSISEP